MSVLPLSPYKEIAGEKNTFVFVRDKRLRKFNYEFRDEDLYGFRASDLENHQKPKALIYDGYRRNLTAGWSLISFGGDLNEPVESLNRDIMNAVKKSRKKTPSTPSETAPVAIEKLAERSVADACNGIGKSRSLTPLRMLVSQEPTSKPMPTSRPAAKPDMINHSDLFRIRSTICLGSLVSPSGQPSW